MEINKIFLLGISISLLFGLVYPTSITSQVPLHEKIVLKGFDGNAHHPR